jgi:DNA-binding MarR family transcriptional regulator
MSAEAVQLGDGLDGDRHLDTRRQVPSLPGCEPGDPSDPADSARVIAHAMSQLFRIHAQLKSRMFAADSEISASFLLFRLLKDGPRRAATLAEEMCTDPSTISRQVASLVRSGLVERRSDPADGRASVLVPTAAGVEHARRQLQRREEAVAPVLDAWSETDRSTFARLLQSYAEGLEQHREAIVASLESLPERSN